MARFFGISQPCLTLLLCPVPETRTAAARSQCLPESREGSALTGSSGVAPRVLAADMKQSGLMMFDVEMVVS